MKEYTEGYTTRYCSLEGAQIFGGKYEGNRNKLGTEGKSEVLGLQDAVAKTAGTMNHGRNDGYACQHLLKASDHEHFPLE